MEFEILSKVKLEELNVLETSLLSYWKEKKSTEKHVERELVRIYSNKIYINESVKPLHGPNNVVDSLLTQEEGIKF